MCVCVCRGGGGGEGDYQVLDYNTVHLPWMCPLCAVRQRMWELLPLTGELLRETEERNADHGTS